MRELWFWEYQPPKQMVTQVLRQPLVLDNKDEVLAERLAEQRAFGRKVAAEKHRQKARLPDEVLAEIALRPDDKPSKVARTLKSNPKIAPLVAHLKQASLAKKIGLLRRQK